MYNVRVTEENVSVEFSRKLLNDRDLMDFLDMVRVKSLISQSELEQKDALRLDKELKSNWWEKNKQRFLAKIK